MELVEGGTLRDVLRARGALGVPAAFAVMEQVLAGLAEAHRLGMVHRDVKPENVLIAGDAAGEGRRLRARGRGGAGGCQPRGHDPGHRRVPVARAGRPPGRPTPAATSTRPASLLYELLTGAPPYTGDTAISVAYRHVNCDVPAPSEVARDVPPELDDLFVRARPAATRTPARPTPPRCSPSCGGSPAVLEVPQVPVPAPPPKPASTEQPTVPHGGSPPRAGPAYPDAGTRRRPPLAAAAGPLRRAAAAAGCSRVATALVRCSRWASG